MEGPSAATKRGAKAVARRGAQTEEMRPLTSSAHNKHGSGTSENGAGGKANLPAPPRSGQFLHQIFSDMTKDDHPKRRYRVNLPYRMLYVLAIVFLMIPLIIFLYKERHLHREHDHFKPQRYVNVNTKDVLSQFSDHAHGTAVLPLTEGEQESPDEVEAPAEEKKPELVKTATETVQPPAIPSPETKEETVKDQQGEITVDQIEQKDQTESKDEKKVPEGDDKHPNNETSDQKVDGENNSSKSKDNEEETKKRIRRRL